MEDHIQESFDHVLAAMTALIIATVRGSNSNRFEEAKKLCDLGQAIQQAKGRAAAPKQEKPLAVPDQEQNPPVVNAPVANVNFVDAHGRPPGRILFDDQGRLVNEDGIVYTGPLDTNALMRHMLMAFGPHAQTGAEANRARAAVDEAVELQALQNIIERAEPATRQVLERRIQQLMNNMERRSLSQPGQGPSTPEMKDEKVPVVPADDQRGHPPDAGGAEGDDAARLRADGIGNAGHGEPPRTRALDQVGTDAVV